MADDTLTPFFKNLFLPEYIGSFHEGFQGIKIRYFSSPDREPTEFTVNPYPFMTLYDLKIMIYQHFRKELSAHPSFQSLLLPVPELVMGNTEEETKFVRNYEALAETYTCFEYTWMKPESKEEIAVINPFSRASGDSADSQFVTETGRKTNTYAIRARMTLEDFTKELALGDTVTLHLFLYKDVVPMMNAELRTSEREWFGRIAPYYPELGVNQPTTSLPADLVKRVNVFDSYVSTTIQQMEALDDILESGTVPLLPMTVAGLRFLRLVWKSPTVPTPSLETLFYTLDVTTERPFLRILPVGSTPITKLKMDTAFKIPDISDPRLLRIWKDERNPKPDTDFLFSKLVVRSTVGTQPALYGTLRMFHDKSADFLIMPPKQLRFLDPRSDLSALGSLLTRGLKNTPYTKAPEVGEASLLCAVRLPFTQKPMSSETLRKRLQHFQPFFQEIPPLPGDKPLLMLRYRAVSNYAVEDKIFSFLTLMVSRTIAKGEAAIPELVVALTKEFQMTEEEAQSKVIYWLRNRGDIQLVIPETKDYIMTYNPGIDIAIFGQQSYYTIHMYRIDSKQVFDRIVTAVSILLSATDRQLGQPIHSAAAVSMREATSVSMPGAARAPSEAVADALVEPPANAAAATTNNNNALESANLGDDMYLRLMMGEAAPQGEDEDGTGEGEVLNLGNALNGERQTNAQNMSVAERVAENSRNAAAAAARALESVRPAQRERKEEAVEAVPEADEENEVTPGKKKKSYQGWVKSQLQIADQRLFQYDTDVAGRKIKKYVTMCQATESRQPYVLNQEQYDIMRETYAADDGVVFVVYPLEAGEALPEAGDEVYTLLKYGTNPFKQNYYLCCQFFCTKDYIMVREKDFYSTTDRQGKPKPGESAPGRKDNGSCPFCHLLEIKVLKSPRSNESVIQRRSKKAESKRHLYVGFLQGETQHPEEFYMPCCFTEDSPLYITDPRFEKVRGDEDEKEDEVKTTVGVPTTSYQITMYRAHKKYIVGPEKEYLKISEIDGPQIGLLPPVLDQYFGQNPKDYVSREANKMELLPNAKCFLRVGVENRPAQRHDSFFAALAPYLDFRNTAESVKARIKEVITPRIFTFLNYGNLVLEFYDPGDPGPTEQDLRLWVSRELQIELTPTNKDAAMRIWKSYHHFLGFLDSTQVKEYRQFAQMIALPGLVATRGLVLIVLELNEKGELNVRCPPFGYNIEQYSQSDVGFILQRPSGIWEPIFYSENRPQGARFRAFHQPDITFQRSAEGGARVDWPMIVKQRVSEFMKQCQSIGRGAYTSSRRIDPMSLLPLSVAIQSMPRDATGVIRDSYNHVVGITYRAKAGKPGLVALPVIDDEFIAVTKTIHLDWDDFTPAPMDLVVKLYQETFERIFALYPGYRVKRRIKSRGTEKYVAIQLANGLYIPAAPPKDESLILDLPLGEVDEMEWSMNREIYFASEKSTSDETLFRAQESEMREIFEHLRLTFSNWFSSEAASAEFRRQIKEIIDSPVLPLFEKRKRLEILLGPMILSWMDSTVPKGDVEGSLLRVDCRLETGPVCPARCVWRQTTNENVGHCYLHSPKQLHLGGRLVNGPRLLMLRLLEELLRFPERRNQLLKGNVTTLVTLKDAVKIGQQYVLPETSLAWQDLLRLDWIEQGKETKKFYEEMSRQGNEKEALETESKEDTTVHGVALPERLASVFGAEDPKTAKLFLIAADVPEDTPPLNPYLVPFGTSAGELGMEEDSADLSRDAVKRLTLQIRRPVLYIDLLSDPVEVFAFSPLKKLKSPNPFILVSTEDGPRVVSSSKKFLEDIKPEKMPERLKQLYEERISIQE
jgi:hypothetical protein